MKLSTRARYGLRMMVELARELRKKKPVQLGRIAKITGLSENYLAQLALPLKSEGLLIGISGKSGGYQLTRPPDQIKVGEVVKAVIGPMHLTDCVNNPDICLNSSFCEARLMWSILSEAMTEILDKYTLEDLIDRDRTNSIRREYAHMPLVDPDRIMSESDQRILDGCPSKTKQK